MQQRRLSLAYRRCCLAILVASTSTLMDAGSLGANETRVPPLLRKPTKAQSQNNRANSPQNSTLQIRVARKPWLFEKIGKPSPAPSIKMRPPRPPAAIPDPPSMSLVIPEDGSGWVTRGRVKTQIPTYADLEINPAKADSQDESEKDSVADEATPETKLQIVKPDTAVSEIRATQDSQEPEIGADVRSDEKKGPAGADDLVGQSEDGASETRESGKSATATKRGSTTDGNGKAASEIETSIGKNSTAKLKGSAVIVGKGDLAESPTESQPKPDASTAADRPVANDAKPEPSLTDNINPASEPTADDNPSVEKMSPSGPETSGTKSSETGTTEAVVSSDSSTAEKVESTVGKNEVTPKSDVKGNAATVKVRKLRLQADGTVSDKSGLAASETESLVAEEKAKKAPVSQFVSSENPLATKMDYTGRPAEPIKLTNSVSRMRNTIKQGLLYHYLRPEAANERSNWGMLHSIMVYGADTKIRVGSRKHSAIAWIAGNNACRGQRLLTLKDGSIAARSGVGLQGHQAQCLAVFALCDVPLDYPIYASSKKFSVRDLVESEMLGCRSGEELTFSLIGLSHYLDTDTVWLNAAGETWSFERLIKEELSQPIVGAACGGTHRLMGFAHALRKRRAAGKPITGQWKRAEIFMNDFEKYVFRLQNRDGSMSTDWFEGREDNGDVDRKIQTTGHMVEWLLTITPDSKLQEPRLVNAVRFLANSIYSQRGHDWKIGPKGHALRSLAMYYERVYGGATAWQSSSVAKSAGQSRR